MKTKKWKEMTLEEKLSVRRHQEMLRQDPDIKSLINYYSNRRSERRKLGALTRKEAVKRVMELRGKG